MRSDRDPDHPTPDSIRDAVVAEDPSRWGSHEQPPARYADEPPPRAIERDERTYPPTTATTRVARERPIAEPPAAEPPVRRPVVSIGATFLGWSVAAFFTIVLSALVLGLTGGVAAADGAIAIGTVATASFVGYLIASFLAYTIGGYAAGRISLWNGVWHGLGTVAWAVIFAIVGVLVALYSAVDVGFAVTLDVTGAGILAIALVLLAMLAGAALGGRFGERYHEARPRVGERRRVARIGGRPG